MTSDDWLKFVWLPLLVTVGGGLVLAAILSIFSQAVRVRFWLPIWRGLRWLGSLRITTTTRQKDAADAIVEAEADRDATSSQLKAVWEALDVRPVRKASTLVMERTEHLRNAAEAAKKDADAKIQAAHAFAEQQVILAARKHANELKVAEANARAEGHQEALQQIKEARDVTPLLRPVWQVIPLGATAFALRNSQSNVELSDVSIEAPLADFDFNGDTQWPGPSNGAHRFVGERKRNGRLFGVRFSVRYRDAHGEWQAGEAWIDKEPRKATIL